MQKFIFIGGFKRGYAVLEDLLSRDLIPEYAYVFQEDEHEHEKFSSKFLSILEGVCKITICRRLSIEDYQSLQNQNFDFAIVCGWRTIIDFDKLNPLLRRGMFAAHDSLLPKYRGFAPTNWAIINGEEEAGVSIFKINAGEVDSGAIYYQGKVPIQHKDDINDVMKKVTAETVKGYTYLVNNLDNIQPIEQIERKASYCCSRRPEDGKIDWERDANTVYNLCRALVFPYPGAFFYFGGKQLLVNKISITTGKHYVGSIPGKVVSVSDRGVEVLCGTGSVLIEELIDNDIPVPAREIIKSIRITLN